MQDDLVKILDYFKKRPGTWILARELIHHFKIPMEGRRSFHNLMQALVRSRQLIRGKGHRYLLAPSTNIGPHHKGRDQGGLKKGERDSSQKASGIESIIKEFRLREAFPQKVQDETRHFSQEKMAGDLKGRRDLRSLVMMTIDGETAKDFDDAVGIQSLSRGHFRLWVSIADVSHYVQPRTAIDREAHQRSTSTYFPARCIPMLPEVLSNNLCSLVPHQDRLTMTAEMDFDATGLLVQSRFYPSVIRSRARLTYREVKQMILDNDAALQKKYASIYPDLKLMEGLCDQLRLRRFERGSLDFDLPEPEIVLNLEEGKVESIAKALRHKAHMMIEEFMIVANEAVATYLTSKMSVTVYRVHDVPDREKMKDFREFIHNMGLGLPGGHKITSKNLAQLIQSMRGRSEERIVNYLLLRSLKQAEYSVDNCGHFGLASPCYTHFTSPIRRYPDLIVHRLLKEALGSSPLSVSVKDRLARRGQMQEMLTHCSEQERVSMKAEWASRDWAVALFMKDKIGKEYEGIICSVTDFGFFVELKEYFVQGLVHIKNLQGDYYVFHEKAHKLQGRRTKKAFKIGDLVKIRVKQVNVEKRRVDFDLAISSRSSQRLSGSL